MLRRRTGALGALGACAVALAMSPPAMTQTALAAPTVLSGSATTWTPDGTPVRGSASAATAPVLKAGASYRDLIASGTTRYYAVHLGAVSGQGDVTDYLSAFAVPPTGAKVGFIDGITLRLQAADGVLCDSYDAQFGGDDETAPVGGVVRRPGAADGVCRAAGTYLLSVRRVGSAGSDPGVWPLDLRHLSEPAASPPPRTAGSPRVPKVPAFTSATPPPLTGAPVPVNGGASMDGSGTRPAGAGLYTDHLSPGQTRYYRVPVDWGQRLFANAEFADATMTAPNGFTANALRVDIYSPVRGYVSGEADSYTGQRAQVGTLTPVIDYDNRYSSDGRVNSATVAGWYWVQVSLHPAVADYTSGGVDVTLRLQVSGTARPGPVYRGDAARAGIGVGPRPPGPAATPATRTPARAAGRLGTRSPGPSPRLVIAYGAFALAAVFLVWPTLLLLRGGRAGRPRGR